MLKNQSLFHSPSSSSVYTSSITALKILRSSVIGCWSKLFWSKTFWFYHKIWLKNFNQQLFSQAIFWWKIFLIKNCLIKICLITVFFDQLRTWGFVDSQSWCDCVGCHWSLGTRWWEASFSKGSWICSLSSDIDWKLGFYQASSTIPDVGCGVRDCVHLV